MNTPTISIIIPAYNEEKYIGACLDSVLEKMKGFDTSIEFYGDDTDTARRARAFGRVRFTPGFYIYTSGRRFVNQGIFNTVGVYVAAFFSETVLHRAPEVQHAYFR